MTLLVTNLAAQCWTISILWLLRSDFLVLRLMTYTLGISKVLWSMSFAVNVALHTFLLRKATMEFAVKLILSVYFPTGRSITADCYPKMISLQTLQVVSGCGCRQLSALNGICHFFATGNKTFRPDPHTHIMTRFTENILFVKNRLRQLSSLVGVLMTLCKPRTTSRGGGGLAGMFFLYWCSELV